MTASCFFRRDLRLFMARPRAGGRGTGPATRTRRRHGRDGLAPARRSTPSPPPRPPQESQPIAARPRGRRGQSPGVTGGGTSSF